MTAVHSARFSVTLQARVRKVLSCTIGAVDLSGLLVACICTASARYWTAYVERLGPLGEFCGGRLMGERLVLKMVEDGFCFWC